MERRLRLPDVSAWRQRRAADARERQRNRRIRAPVLCAAMLLALGEGALAQPPDDLSFGFALAVDWGGARSELRLSGWHRVPIDNDGAPQMMHLPILRWRSDLQAPALASEADSGAPGTGRAKDADDEDSGYSAWLYAGLVVSGLAVVAAVALANGRDHSDEAGEFARDQILENYQPCQPIPRICLP